MRKRSGEAPPRPGGRGGATEAGAAFLAFVLIHAGCGDGAAEFRLGERSLACWCQRCDELKVFAAGDHGA